MSVTSSSSVPGAWDCTDSDTPASGPASTDSTAEVAGWSRAVTVTIAGPAAAPPSSMPTAIGCCGCAFAGACTATMRGADASGGTVRHRSGTPVAAAPSSARRVSPRVARPSDSTTSAAGRVASTDDSASRSAASRSVASGSISSRLRDAAASARRRCPQRCGPPSKLQFQHRRRARSVPQVLQHFRAGPIEFRCVHAGRAVRQQHDLRCCARRWPRPADGGQHEQRQRRETQQQGEGDARRADVHVADSRSAARLRASCRASAAVSQTSSARASSSNGRIVSGATAGAAATCAGDAVTASGTTRDESSPRSALAVRPSSGSPSATSARAATSNGRPGPDANPGAPMSSTDSTMRGDPTRDTISGVVPLVSSTTSPGRGGSSRPRVEAGRWSASRRCRSAAACDQKRRDASRAVGAP